MTALGLEPTDAQLKLMLDRSGKPPKMDACFELRKHALPGLHTTTAKETCGVLTRMPSTSITIEVPNALIVPGLEVSGTGISPGVRVSAVEGTALTLSSAQSINAGVVLTFAEISQSTCTDQARPPPTSSTSSSTTSWTRGSAPFWRRSITSSVVRRGSGCSFELRPVVPDVPVGSTVQDVCESACGANTDVCGIVRGDGSSCAARVLAQAWENCPQACESCDINKRGCLDFSSSFISRLGVVGSIARLIGIAVYAAYFKQTPYGKLLMGSIVALALCTCFDLLTVTSVDASEKGIFGGSTVLGVDGHVFTIFDEVSKRTQVKHVALFQCPSPHLSVHLCSR